MAGERHYQENSPDIPLPLFLLVSGFVPEKTGCSSQNSIANQLLKRMFTAKAGERCFGGSVVMLLP
jgi:hypothetical protein